MHALFEVLIKNAIDYSPEGTTVNVSVVRKDGHAVVQVKDRGIGIRPDAKQKIFSEFYRTNEAAAKCPEGSGLGLTIAAHIAQLHGFTIRVHSTVGKGATFSVSIPLQTRPRRRRS
jgi:two-component system sensor histidine kinase SenX3